LNRYGHFSEDKREFIITRPDTPAPWVNYISNGKYTGLISHTGGGFSFYGSPRDNRITRWRYNALPVDRPGRYILIRDQSDGQYWSPTWQPTRTKLDRYECRHGMYYTRIQSSYGGIEATLLYFVTPDDCEVWRVSLKNNSSHLKQLNLFAFQELCLGHALVDLINQPNDQHFNEVIFDRDAEILLASKRYWVKFSQATVKQANEDWDKIVYFASTEPIKGWDGSKNEFIGRWRSESDPVAVERGCCSNSEITAGDAMAALQVSIDLGPEEEKELAFIMGIVPKTGGRSKAIDIIRKYRSVQTINAVFGDLQAQWRDYLTCVAVDTPDDQMNTLLNVWNQYQTSVTFLCSRDASYYHGGLLFGRGYRDSCQDIMGPVMAKPEWVRERIIEMSRFQFSDGSTFHLYYPMTGGGERTGHSDTPLWLPLAIMVYLKETGETDFLNTITRFYDGGEASLRDHLFAAINYTIANLTERRLAKFGPGDWNDTLDYLGRQGRGESVWVTMFLAYILKETISLCDFMGEPQQASRYRTVFQTVAEALNTHCWDGAWYIRGTNDHGGIIGSSKNKEGRIFLNTQSWAVISGIAGPQRGLTCMNSVIDHLETPKGPKILDPAYTVADPNIGLATRCVPGKKENGAVFNHPVSWAIMAECLLGRGDRAFEIYKKAQPMNPVIDIDRYEVEPYVYAEYVTSPDHPTFGQASHSWLTGSSTWMLRDGIDYILGVRPTYSGLMIDPCIPHQWSGYRITRRFRGIRYQIQVENPHHLCRGNVRITLLDQPLPSNLIDLNDAATHAMLQGRTEVTLTAVIE